jgi:hypothetical protein
MERVAVAVVVRLGCKQRSSFRRWVEISLTSSKEGGCVNIFAQGFTEGGSSHLIPDLPAGSGVDDAIRTGAQAAATTYAINQGLTVPLRSSICLPSKRPGEIIPP